MRTVQKCIYKFDELPDDVIEGLDGDEIKDAVEEYLQDNTTVVGRTSTGFVYQQF